MNAEEIRRALFPHEETIKRLQTEIVELKAHIKELENATNRHATDIASAKTNTGAKRPPKKEDTPS